MIGCWSGPDVVHHEDGSVVVVKAGVVVEVVVLNSDENEPDSLRLHLDLPWLAIGKLDECVGEGLFSSGSWLWSTWPQ